MIVNPFDGFPIWGNRSPQKPSTIPGRQISMMMQDAAINQAPGGNAREIKITQKLIPRAARAEGPGTTPAQNVGMYGTNLYDSFMTSYTKPPEE